MKAKELVKRLLSVGAALRVCGFAFADLAGIVRSECVDADPKEFWSSEELFNVPRCRPNPYENLWGQVRRAKLGWTK